ncbi:hypothetical protein GQ43DRAFT_479330 [Delitschia confertaspora ATCC 74209]|uniref:Uncharacterized protein n=1 Tax=Delitschia confertaspora ATCC 74209 TaxID=1513339 RepID=A0A9P4JRN9_9PLEO|nr:hypothetical protein GQ43DRAFT_479330 [Delitschia confertaspora ATCC 74209]
MASITLLMILQKELSVEGIPIGSSLVMFMQTIGGSIYISVAQALSTNNLTNGFFGLGIEGLGIEGLDKSDVANGGITTIT